MNMWPQIMIRGRPRHSRFYLGRYFYIAVTNFGENDFCQPEQYKVVEVANAPKRAVYMNDTCYYYIYSTQLNKISILAIAVLYKAALDRLESVAECDAVKAKVRETLRKAPREDAQLPCKVSGRSSGLPGNAHGDQEHEAPTLRVYQHYQPSHWPS